MPAPTIATESPRFEFGRNWSDYLAAAFNPARADAARRSVVELTGLSDLSGLSFLDVGCGSGLFSLAAHALGARVVSIDLDPLSVQCCETLRERAAGNRGEWTVVQRSILEDNLPDTLGRFDVVYAWGVLHHTGSMWTALEHCAPLVRPGGLLCVALYNEVESRVWGSRTWWRIKHLYVRSPTPVRRLLEVAYGGFKAATLLLTLRNPLKVAREYQAQRGMSLWHDWVDWLGGFPYEFASAGHVFAFGRERLGFELIRLRTTSSIGCNEFVFRKPGQP